jgi:enoyl-[acyl-carrier protein] reductase II
MRGMTFADMAAAVSNSGGYGQIAASGLPGDRLQAELKKVRRLTDRPVGVNIPVYRPNAREALEIAIDMGIKAVTTSAGDPRKLIDRIKAAGLRVLHKVSTLDMALKAQAAGVDGVIATGFEAGGHIGKTDATTLCLVPQLADALEVPVVAAGGIADARGLVAALVLGAEGVEMGTRFLATHECPVSGPYKDHVLRAKCESTTVVGDERMQLRVLQTETNGVGEDGGNGSPEKGGKQGAAVMSCGQAAGLIREITGTAQVIPEMVAAVRSLSQRLDGFLEEGNP